MCEGGKGGSKSRITENKTVLSQFRLRVVYSQFTKKKRHNENHGSRRIKHLFSFHGK